MNRDALVRLFTGLVVGLRWVVVPAWMAAAAACALLLPGLGSGEPLPLGGLVPKDAEATAVGERSAALFRIPLTADTVVVQRDPDGLAAGAQARAVARAVAANAGRPRPEGLAFALPVLNTFGLVPSSRESGTTALSFLFFDSAASFRTASRRPTATPRGSTVPTTRWWASRGRRRRATGSSRR